MSDKKRVLIVDDEIDTLKLLKMIVEISGYEAYTTLNSLEALTLAQVEQPDVVLLDIMMPKMDGFQLCKLMRSHPETRDLPVIFVTAYSALDLEDRRKAAGGDMVLPKPIAMDKLIDAIDKVQTMERSIPADIQKASSGLDGAETPETDTDKSSTTAQAEKSEKSADKAESGSPETATSPSTAAEAQPSTAPEPEAKTPPASPGTEKKSDTDSKG